MKDKYYRKQKTCENCYYGEICPADETCEFYDPLDEFEIAEQEYDEDLYIRYLDYLEIIDEFGGE